MTDRTGSPGHAGAETSVVITCFNQARYLCDAIRSARDQTVPAAEIIVVDDGSTDDTAAVASTFQEVRLIRQPNRGLAAARNTGLRGCSGAFVIFLDADDCLLPRAIESGRDALRRRPEAAFAYGRFRYVDSGSMRRPSGLRGDVRDDVYLPLLRGNFISMHGTVAYRSLAVTEAGGFDESLGACEDYDLYLRLARERPVIPHDEIVAEYRLHDANMSRDSLRMLKTSLAALSKQRPFLHDDARRRAYRHGRQGWIHRYGPGVLRDVRHLASTGRWRQAVKLTATLGRLAPLQSVLLACGLAVRRRRSRHVPANRVRWGSFRRLAPVSTSFGFDRGQPVDRYYVEMFLREFAGDVRGHVLEVGDDGYTRRLSDGKVTRIDILHVDNSNPRATIVANLANADHVASNTFDCIILTQTLHLIYDLQASVRTLHRILKPNGVLLATVPGITPISADRWGQTWYWSLTELAARRLFEAEFQRAVVTHIAGNVLAATAFLYGLAAEELRSDELDHFDPRYPVTIGIRAIK